MAHDRTQEERHMREAIRRARTAQASLEAALKEGQPSRQQNTERAGRKLGDASREVDLALRAQRGER